MSGRPLFLGETVSAIAGRVNSMYPSLAADGFAGPLQMLVYLTTLIAFVFSLLTVPR